MLVLSLLSREDMHAPQIIRSLEEESGRALTMTSPYMLLYRLIEKEYILEAYKKIAPDGRRRQYYQITEEGRGYLEALKAVYRRVSAGVEQLLERGTEPDGQ
ncbi:MAG: hypothetical protein HFG08_00920 [Oscillibacter sp.]|nr:hypothetical protein [Oscillibacter sp.]